MTDKSKIRLDVGVDKLVISADGDVIPAAGSKLADILSPFTESLGLLGDLVHQQRQSVALKGIAKINEISEARGLNLKPVPPKFLIKWVDGISMENEGSNLFEMWTELFLSSASKGKFSGNNLVFIRILKEITSREAEVLQYLCSAKLKAYSNFVPLDADDFTQNGYDISKEAKLQLNPRSIVWDKVSMMSIHEAHNYIVSSLEERNYGVSYLYSSSHGKLDDKAGQHIILDYRDEYLSIADHEGVLNLLKSLNLIASVNASHVMPNPKYEFNTELIFPLPVAFDLLKQCLGTKYPNKLYSVVK